MTVPYGYFVSQIHQSNVVSVTGQGSTVQGRFRHSVTYPTHSGTTSTLFATTRPTFAHDNLLSEWSERAGGEREVDQLRIGPVADNPRRLAADTAAGQILVCITQRYRGEIGQGGLFGIGRAKARKCLGADASAQTTGPAR